MNLFESLKNFFLGDFRVLNENEGKEILNGYYSDISQIL
jgi:hypothetical protein